MSSGDVDMAAGQTKLSRFRRNHPMVQNLIVSACLFCDPGLFLAITLLGAGGGKPTSVTMGDTSNGVSYGVFFFSAIFAGPVLNTVGPRLTLMAATLGYPVFMSSMWYYDVRGQLWFPVLAGVCSGLSAGCLWTTAAFVANAYAEEKDKGMWRAIQWCSTMSGATVGSLVALGINWNAKSTGVPKSVYITFIVIQCSSLAIASLMLPIEKLRRSDGTGITIYAQVSIKSSLMETARLFTDWRILLMLPAFFVPEMFFPFQSSMNAYAFNLRTRTLNSLLNNLIQLPTALGAGMLLDSERLGSRRRRALIVITIEAVWILGTYVAQTIWLESWNFDRSVPGPNIDVTDKAYAGAVVIYMLYAAQYGMFQNLILWTLGTLSNDPKKVASMAGLLVGVLSAGTAVSFGIDATEQPYRNENAALFAITALVFPILYYIAWNCTTDTNYAREENVIVPLHVLEKTHLDKTEVRVESA